MYVLEYCDNPENAELRDGHISYEDSFSDEYLARLRDLDRFMFLADMFRIMQSCTADFLELPDGKDVEFWQVNKSLINYLNAVYSYKEYVNSYDPPLKEITDGYYYEQKWYRFVCDYRNRVIHQSTILKDRNIKTGDVYIDLDDMVSIQQGVIDELIETQQKQKHIKNARRFLKEIKELADNPTLVTREGKHFKSMKGIVSEADSEISAMNNDILMFAFNKAIAPAILWFLKNTHKENGRFWYTFIVNKQWIGIPEKEPILVFEPAFSVESFYQYLLQCLGPKNPVCIAIRDLLETEGYCYSYELDCSIDDFHNRSGK